LASVSVPLPHACSSSPPSPATLNALASAAMRSFFFCRPWIGDREEPKEGEAVYLRMTAGGVASCDGSTGVDDERWCCSQRRRRRGGAARCERNQKKRAPVADARAHTTMGPTCTHARVDHGHCMAFSSTRDGR
jgi:hypothetical protein